MSQKHPYFGELVEAQVVSGVAAHHWEAVKLPPTYAPFLSRLKRGAHLYTLASGSQIEPVLSEIDGWPFEVVMGMTRYRYDPFDVERNASVNVDEYRVFKVVTHEDGLYSVSYRAVQQPPGRDHWLPAVPDRVLWAPELTE